MCMFSFKIENTPIKDTNGKRKFERILSFLFVVKWELFAMKLSFERDSTLFSSLRIRALCLFWTNRGNEVSEETWGTFCILFGQGKSVFKRKFLYIFLKDSWTFSTFLHRRDRKPQNVHLKLIFCHVLSRFNLRERIHVPVSVTRITF